MIIDTVQQRLIREGLMKARQTLLNLRYKLGEHRKNATLREATFEIEDILENIGNLNVIAATPLETKQFSLRDLVLSIGQMYKPYFRKHHIEFRPQIENILVQVDKMTFFHIFFNLIHYMGDFVDKKSRTTSFISVEAKPYNEELVAIYIEDNGRYPVDVHQGKQPFDTSYNKRVLDTIAGVGSGVVKEWVIAIKGSIQLVDKLSQGIKCCLLLPGKKNDFLREQAGAQVPNEKKDESDQSSVEVKNHLR
ncbi:MAG TPA: sensor histidine kinase [Microscillaceae bacterium]|nr:sensor histidine kinase [Microscillaceae bacterium]